MEDIKWVVNLANSICGVSLLALPYCFSQCGVILGSIMLMLCALLTTWSIQLLTDCVFETKVFSCEEIAYRVYGTKGKLLLQICCALFMLGTCAAFFIIIADLAESLFLWMTAMPNVPYLRILILLSLSTSIALPLSLLRHLESLSTVSAASMCFYAWLTLQLIVYSLQNLSGVTNHIKLWRMSSTLHVVPIYATSFGCHLQLVVIIKEIVGEVREGDNESVNRIKRICKLSVMIIAMLYGSVALFGHITFATVGVHGDVLTNFDDGIVAQITRMGFMASVFISVPFMVNPCRTTIYMVIFGKTESYIPTSKHFYITLGILVTAFIVAVCTPNIEFLLGLSGSILGATICFIFPGLSYLHLKSNTEEAKDRWKAMIVLATGIFLLFGGTIANLYPSNQQDTNNAIENLIPNVKHQIKVLVPTDNVQTNAGSKLSNLPVNELKKGEMTGRVLSSQDDNSLSDNHNNETVKSDFIRRSVSNVANVNSSVLHNSDKSNGHIDDNKSHVHNSDQSLQDRKSFSNAPTVNKHP